MKGNRKQLEQAIAALEAQRSVLGDAIVDTSIIALRQQLASSPAPEQRKQVTVLFSDWVGFTALSELMDPEDVSLLMSDFATAVTPVITQYGGIIQQFIGDAVFAVFGLPQAQENDPENGVRTALAMHNTLQSLNQQLLEANRPPIGMRIGVVTGPVFVTQHPDKPEKLNVVGETVTLAEKFESAAPHDGTLIDRPTYQHVRGLFEIDAGQPLSLANDEAPIATYVVKEAKPRAFRLKTRGVEGIETHMVGRNVELKQLQSAFATAVAKAQLQFIIITGDAGVGKSRLLHEFDGWLELLPEQIWYYKGRASLEMQHLPYALLRDLFAFRFQIQESDRAEIVRQKFTTGITDILGNSKESQIKAQIIGQLLGFDSRDESAISRSHGDARQLRDQAQLYLQEYLTAVAREDPAIILLEDIHWSDESSLTLLNQLIPTLAHLPIVIVSVTRPILFERWSDWGKTQKHTTIPLGPLTREQSRLLINEILQKLDDVPITLRELIVSVAEGNPLYLEEFIKSLIEDHVIIKSEPHWQVDASRLAQVRVPSTLTGILQARLDSLPAAEKRLLQQASVVGRTFWDSVIARMSEATETGDEADNIQQALTALGAKELIFGRDTSTFIQSHEYIFKHTILRDVTYESLIKRLRRSYHNVVADWLVEQSGDRQHEYMGLIAEHLELAEESSRAAVYLYKAGRQAAEQYANHEAVSYLGRALDLLLPDDRDLRYDVLLAREKIYDLLGDRVAQAADLTALQQLAQGQMNTDADIRRMAESLLQQVDYYTVIGEFSQGETTVTQTIHLAQKIAAVDIEAQSYSYWGLLARYQGDYTAAVTRLEIGLDLAQQANSPQIEATIYHSLNAIAYDMGNYDEARAYSEKTRDICRQLNDRRGEGRAMNSLGNASSSWGDYEDAINWYTQAIAVAQSIGDRRAESIPLLNLGIIVNQLGQYEQARAHFEKFLQIKREITDRPGEVWGLSFLSLLHHHLGENETALTYAQQALQLAEVLGDINTAANAALFQAHAHAGLAQFPEARSLYERATRLRQELRQGSRQMESVAGLARVALAEGKLAEALHFVDEILAFIAQNSVEGVEETLRIYLTCYQVLMANEDVRQTAVLQAAYDVLQRYTTKLHDDDLRDSYQHRVQVNREILQAATRWGLVNE